MMFKISKEKFPDYVDFLIKNYEVWGPKKIGNEYVFSELNSGKEFIDIRTLLGPKDLIYSPYEKLFENNFKEIIVLGIKSCDLRAYKMLDDVLGIDSNYSQRRKMVHMFNFVCTEPCRYGFCTTFYGPRLEEFEMQFTDIGDHYLVETGDTRFINDLFVNANENDLKLAIKKSNNVYEKMQKLNTEKLNEKIKWDNPLWKEFSQRCISCGACNFACPTCFCFDVYDENDRYREWDSCILAGFTKLAGNANPRPTLDLRLRQRFMHKLKFHYENFDYHLCTGCGRCIEVCPVNIDIREVIRSVNP
ncbi:MAG: 4Fe-4S dicluster domain-containing protein [Thermoplasmata archaeon]